MFGYVRVYKPELKIKDFEAYRGVYCSLCRQLGKDYGVLSRLILNYDFSLLALFRMALTQECPGYEAGRCPFNPTKKCSYCIKTDELSFSAAAAVIMSYYKICDNISDNGFFKSLAMRLIKPFFSRKRRKAAKRYPQIENIISSAMQLQAQAEKRSDICIDAAAEPSAKAMSSLLLLGFENNENAAFISRTGYLIGRWVYLMDAADDFEDDKKSGSFNPFVSVGADREKIISVLNLTAGELYNEIKHLEFFRYRDIIENIAVDGTYHTMCDVIERKGH